MTPDAPTPILDRIQSPADVKNLDLDEMERLSQEIRNEVVRVVSVTGGHLGASLGVVELTVALHHVFDLPEDKLIWDVGHQSYPHKMLTGRRDRMPSLRQGGGLSGFVKRSESEYDPFGTGHSSTSISAALGMAAGRDLGQRDNHVIAVIGDGSMSAGMAYEAMNNAGYLKSRMIVILNDNDMSIAPPVGALSAYLSRVVSSKSFLSLRGIAKDLSKRLPRSLEHAAARADAYSRGFVTGGTLFEELGFYYIGPIDGHNMDHLLPVLRNARDAEFVGGAPGPLLIHVVTEKGKGYRPAEEQRDKYHGVGRFDVVTGEFVKGSSNTPSYTKVFGEALVREAERDDKIAAITAAMPAGTGTDLFGKRFPHRFFDVGIAEQHAVTFAAGLACEGMKPFCAIYSSFLQRAYDQVVHDVALQNLPVRFPIDRAGQVGADGATHAGAFDLAFLGCIPNMVIMAAADEAELDRMVTTAALYDDGPIAFRYPRGDGIGVEMPDPPTPLEIGLGRVVREGTKVAILSLGTRLQAALQAAEDLAAQGVSCTVADARFVKPLDLALIDRLAAHHEVLITVEEGSVGGFGSLVAQHLASTGRLDGKLRFRPMVLPDLFLDHDTQERQYDVAGLSAGHIAAAALTALGREVMAAAPGA